MKSLQEFTYEEIISAMPEDFKEKTPVEVLEELLEVNEQAMRGMETSGSFDERAMYTLRNQMQFYINLIKKL